VPTFDTSLDRRSSPAGSNVPASIRPVCEPSAKGKSGEELFELLARTARGERAAFARLYANTAPKLFGIVIRILGRRDLANAVLEDVYMRVWQHASDFDPESGPPIAWMAALARSRALDEVKRKGLVRTPDDCPEVPEEPLEKAADTDQERREERRRLLQGLSGLEPERRRALLRAYYYGMSREEIARLTDRPAASVKAWLRTSLAQLKGCLSQ